MISLSEGVMVGELEKYFFFRHSGAEGLSLGSNLSRAPSNSNASSDAELNMRLKGVASDGLNWK